MRRIAFPVAALRRSSRRLESDSGQTLVEYALIIAIIALGALLALGFLSGKINSLFSKAGNSVNGVQVVDGAAGGPPVATPPSDGTTVVVSGVTYTYRSPGPAHTGGTGDCGGSDAACGGHTGFYYVSGGPPSGTPAAFSSSTGTWSGGYTSNPPWTFGCTWHTNGSWGAFDAGCW
jgi:Flp pilus assembly pilin Flp